jgi:AmpD protein
VLSDAGEKELSTYSVSAIKTIFRFYGVSAHYVLDREGTIHELVPPDKLAFHAGKSKMPAPEDGRESVNNFSIGIELLGTETSGFTEAQYQSLQWLIGNLKQTFPIKNLLGHSQIAPGRKTDPHNFNWSRVSL